MKNQLPATTTRILLHHFRWDKEKLMERFYDGDQERLFREAHIVSPFKINNNNSFNRKVSSTQQQQRPIALSQQQSKDKDCNICYLTKNEESMSGLECGHRFCKQCWKDYLTTKIMDEGMGQVMTMFFIF